jgi:C4-dicarboxylate-specific signal transduction histidine kinase
MIARTPAMTKKTERPTEKLDVNETIREVLVLIGNEAKKNNIVISGHFADSPYPVLGDRVQLQQVALNLMMNAFESMRPVVNRERELVLTTINDDADMCW